MEYKSLYICLLIISVHIGLNVVIFIIRQTRFKLSALSPETYLAYNSDSYKIPHKTPTESKKVPINKPNSPKHVRHTVPKLQETLPLYQTASNACQFNSTTVCTG